MKLAFVRLIFAVLLAITCLSGEAIGGQPTEIPPTFAPPDTVEAWRIRIENYAQGPISISIDGGINWEMVGRVTAPATQNLMGYLAAGYAPISTVAATAIHGIRIRVGDTSTAYPPMINIVPAEFAQTPNYFGGHISGASGIYTDIPTGSSIFREFAPYVGSIVLVKSAIGTYHPIPINYSPAVNDSLMIVVKRPVNPLRELIIENKEGGDVTVTYANGDKSIVTHVAKPVLGIGRFDGCSYTGVGAINTNHTCVITVSTAPITKARELEGTGEERRGGFQIVPSYHNTQTEEAGAPQMLVIGTLKSKIPEMEGTPPIFYGYFNLAWSPDDPAHSWICQVRHGDQATWEPMPTLIGNQPDAFQKLGITAFRIAREADSEDAKWTGRQVAMDVLAYTGRRAQLASAGKDMIARGTERFRSLDDPMATPQSAAYAQFYLDGELVGITNTRPYDWDWNTRHVADGEHTLESRILDENGATLSYRRLIYWVDNLNVIKQASLPTTVPGS